MSGVFSDDRFITFSLNGEVYAIEVLKIQEVIYIPEITVVPGAPPFVVGVVNLRGILLTVIDTSMEFGLRRVEGVAYSRIVVVSLGEDDRIGLLVDSVSEVMTLDSGEREPLPALDSGDLGRYAHHIIHHNGHPVTLLEMDPVVERVSWE